MDIQPSNTPRPKYPALATLALAAALSASACQQEEPQRTAGAPLPPPAQQRQRPSSTIGTEKPAQQQPKKSDSRSEREKRIEQKIRSGQLVPGKASVTERQILGGSMPVYNKPADAKPQP